VTLDPIHVENIAQLAYGIAGDVDTTDHDDLAGRVWREWLPELRHDGRVVIEPSTSTSAGGRRSTTPPLTDRPFETVHGLDSGTINPTTFKNGLVVDVAHAAMARAPTDLDLHRDRTIVATVHAGDSTANFDGEWTSRDDGHTRQRVLHAPRVNRYAEGVVHALALYLAEGTHALDHADEVDDLLVLDGPIYPKELFTWDDRNPELGALAREAKPRAVVEKYVRLVERFVERDVPLAGFVKNPPAGRSFARWLGRASNRRGPTTRRFSPGSGAARGRRGRRRQPTRPRRRRAHLHHVVPQSGRRRRDDGRRRRRARHRTRARPGAVRADVHGRVRPRTDVTYKLEAPYAFARDPSSIRERLTRQVLADVATTGVRRRRSRRPTSWRGSRRRKDRAPPEVRGTLRQRPAGDLRRSAVGKEPY